MYRFFTALFVLACIVGVSAKPSWADEKVCHTVEALRVEATKISDKAIFATLDADAEAILFHALAAAGVPEPPQHDLVAVVKWPARTFSILLFRGGCLVASKNGLPIEVLGRDA